MRIYPIWSKLLAIFLIFEDKYEVLSELLESEDFEHDYEAVINKCKSVDAEELKQYLIDVLVNNKKLLSDVNNGLLASKDGDER